MTTHVDLLNQMQEAVTPARQVTMDRTLSLDRWLETFLSLMHGAPFPILLCKPMHMPSVNNSQLDSMFAVFVFVSQSGTQHIAYNHVHVSLQYCQY